MSGFLLIETAMNSPLKNISSLARYAASSFMLLALFGVLPGLAQASACHACGAIVSVHTCQQPAAHGSGVGMVTGAVVGGLLGNQVGGGNGRTFATAAGAVGGGYAGNAIEMRVRSHTVTRVRVRMNNVLFARLPKPVTAAGCPASVCRVRHGALTRA